MEHVGGQEEISSSAIFICPAPNDVPTDYALLENPSRPVNGMTITSAVLGLIKVLIDLILPSVIVWMVLQLTNTNGALTLHRSIVS